MKMRSCNGRKNSTTSILAKDRLFSRFDICLECIHVEAFVVDGHYSLPVMKVTTLLSKRHMCLSENALF